ncbi:cytotoxic and regulatory T-cell molecule [Alosa sapidissima]|uniref:cytotoxic and regulatory T-cell molecule n=1 Tax=Alosa sapidissima TaxID=34773 RepID=UPI001C09BF0A|nr:cytotoxic and regulatory T-cell molecule [Alosa sapidissima]
MKMTHATDLSFLVLILCGIGMSSAVTHVTVMEGERLTLKCRKSPGHMDWKNKRDEVLFFNNIKACLDSRYSILSFSGSDYTLAVSPVTFKDEGMYSCYHYSNNSPKVTVRRYNVTVLGAPKITYTKHGDRTLVKCSAKGNTPPVVSWQIGSGIDLEARPQYKKQDKTGKWTTEDIISIKVLTREETLKCVLLDPTLRSPLGVRFVTLENKEFKQYTTQTSTAQMSTSATSHTTDSPHVSTYFSITGGTDHMNTTSMETSQHTDTNINTTSTLEGSSSTPVNTSSTLDNSTSVTENVTRNFTEEVNEKQERREGGSASLFITAVTALIICLLIVVTFFVVKLRRAHKKWKLEKEDSDQSVESGKSKSSGEEGKPKVSLGFLKSNFRKYRSKEGAFGTQTSASTSASTLASNPTSGAASHSASHTVEVTVENHAINGIKPTQNHGAAPVKETEL